MNLHERRENGSLSNLFVCGDAFHYFCGLHSTQRVRAERTQKKSSKKEGSGKKKGKKKKETYKVAVTCERNSIDSSLIREAAADRQ